jgi:hypothetical protein
MGFHYDGRIFKAIANAENGEVTADTLFHYHQQGNVVWATYEGGAIAFGTLVASVAVDGTLDMRYSHVNRAGELMTGKCFSTPERLADGRYRLHEHWQWTSGDQSSGTSVIEEIKQEDSLH